MRKNQTAKFENPEFFKGDSSQGKNRSRVKLPSGIEIQALFGNLDINLKQIESALGVRLSSRGDEVFIQGPDEQVDQASRVLDGLVDLLRNGHLLRSENVDSALRALEDNPSGSSNKPAGDTISIATKKRLIVPRTPGQTRYLEAIRENDLTIGIGPAGTGKTYLAMTMAVSALSNKQVSRIILTRPAVEAGENLGYLPGDMYAKINPYLRPLYDALFDMIEVEKANRLVERGEIEIAPLAYMRGRTLNDSFIILDEAQNATTEQMKMFVTRLGFNSKAVITGDVTQIDLPSERRSGLVEVRDILEGIGGIQFINFTEKDVVRHRLVQEIIKAYEQHEARNGKNPKG